MARTKHTPLKEGIVAHTKQTGGEELPPAQQSKRRAAAVVVKPNKRPRADVHPIQKALADRVPDEPGIIVAPNTEMRGRILNFSILPFGAGGARGPPSS